jgi:uncharacterized protein (TIGR00266 family)
VICIVCGVALSGPIAYQIVGTVMPAVEVSLDPGQKIVAQTGALGWMTDTINMNTVAAGSPWAMFGRMISGATPLVSEFSAGDQAGVVAFTPRVPGKIVALQVDGTHDYALQSGSFLAAQDSVTVSPRFQQNLGTMFFGGEGFVLQRIHGNGLVFAQIDGEVVQYELAPRQTLLAEPGSVALFDSGVGFSIRRVKGIKNILFSEGLFLAELRGPGNVWLQTLPFARLVSQIASRIQVDARGGGAGAVASGMSQVLGAVDPTGIGGALGTVLGNLG